MAAEDEEKKRFTRWFIENLNPVMGAVIGLFVLVLFCVAIGFTIYHLADPPVAASDTQDAYSPFDRAVQVVGLVSPVLTIVLGFYFGTRVGTGGVEAAQAAAKERVQGVKDQSAENLRMTLDTVAVRHPEATSTINELRGSIETARDRSGDDAAK